MNGWVGAYLIVGVVWLICFSVVHASIYSDAKRYNESRSDKKLRQAFAICIIATPIWPFVLLCLISYCIYRVSVSVMITLTDKEPK